MCGLLTLDHALSCSPQAKAEAERKKRRYLAPGPSDATRLFVALGLAAAGECLLLPLAVTVKTMDD